MSDGLTVPFASAAGLSGVVQSPQIRECGPRGERERPPQDLRAAGRGMSHFYRTSSKRTLRVTEEW